MRYFLLLVLETSFLTRPLTTFGTVSGALTSLRATGAALSIALTLVTFTTLLVIADKSTIALSKLQLTLART